MSSSTAAVFAAMFMLPGAVAHAGTNTHGHPHHMEEIEITADPLAAADAHLIAPVSVLDREALRSASMRSVGESVANEPGVTSSDFGAAVGRPVIRGLGGARVRVLENGIGAMDLSTISADHGVSVEPLFAEQIEIFRGPATLLYGSGASGGLVNIVNGRMPDSIPDGPEASAYGHYDTVSDGWLGAFRMATGVGSNVAVHADGMVRGTDDVRIPGFAETTPEPGSQPGRLPNSDADSHSVNGGASFLGARGRLGFSVGRYENAYGVPGFHHEAPAGGPALPPGAGTRIDQRQTRIDVSGDYDPGFALLDSVRLRWGHNDYEHDEIEASGEIGTRFANREWEGRLELVLLPVGPFDGVIGMQLRDRDFDAVGEEAFVPPATLDSAAAFAFGKADFGRLHVDAGARFEAQSANPAGGERVRHDTFSVSGGMAYRFDSGFEVGLSATRTQRAPTIEELFARGPHLASNTFEFGEAGLERETSTNVDLFWRRRGARWTFDFTVFRNDIQNFVYLESSDRDGNGLADRVEDDFLASGVIVSDEDALLLLGQVQRDAEFTGFELEARVTLLDNGRGVLEAHAWSDYVHSDLGGGQRAPRIPPLRFGGGFEWEQGAAYAGLRITRVTAKRDLAPLETPTDGYTMLDVHAGYTWTAPNLTRITLFARGTNLTNTVARRHTSFVKDLSTLPGIGGTFGIRVDL